MHVVSSLGRTGGVHVAMNRAKERKGRARGRHGMGAHRACLACLTAARLMPRSVRPYSTVSPAASAAATAAARLRAHSPSAAAPSASLPLLPSATMPGPTRTAEAARAAAALNASAAGADAGADEGSELEAVSSAAPLHSEGVSQQGAVAGRAAQAAAPLGMRGPMDGAAASSEAEAEAFSHGCMQLTPTPAPHTGVHACVPVGACSEAHTSTHASMQPCVHVVRLLAWRGCVGVCGQNAPAPRAAGHLQPISTCMHARGQ